MQRELRRKFKNEKNLFKETYKIIYKYIPDLFNKFDKLTDKRNQSYTKYDMKTICAIRLLALISGITTMSGITDNFDTSKTAKNISKMLDIKINNIPHHDTINAIFKNINIDEINNIKNYIIKTLLRTKMFDKYKYNTAIYIAFDGSGISNHNYNLNNNCLYRKHRDGRISYYKYVLEAKLIMGPLVFSLGTEFIENNTNDGNITSENQKQDCELKAFKRLAQKIKKEYPKQKFIVGGDALYAVEPIINICETYNWYYIFNLKKDRLKNLYEEFEDNINYENDTKKLNYYLSKNMIYKKHQVNVFKYENIKIKKNKKSTTIFSYISNLPVTNSNIKKIVSIGRSRWKIENEGFYTQKHRTFNIGHLNSKDDNAMKIHYLFIQIAHIIRQLLEKGSLILKNTGIKIKEVSEFFLHHLTSTIIPNHNNINLKFQLRFDDLII